MAYTSDLRAKNILTMVDFKVRAALIANNINTQLEFRVLDESKEDAILWENGGLTVTEPVSHMELGSNDGGWFINGRPLLIVEGTFGTERGQTGDSQFNRNSHSLGPALNGYYGVTMVPFVGQYFKNQKNKKKTDIISNNICYVNDRLRKDMALLSLAISEKYEGKYLIIDPYNIEILENLLLELIKRECGLKNDVDIITNQIIDYTKNYVNGYKYGSNGRSLQVLDKVHFTDGSIKQGSCRYYSHNLESLTTSSKRDGHGLLGKNLMEMYLAEDKCISIFIRLDNADFEVLKRNSAKEFHFILNSPRIDVYNFDDLQFDDDGLKRKVEKIKHQNLHTNAEKGLMKELQKAFINGEIKLKIK